MHRARLPIAQPCHERFDTMAGDGAQRFCDKCSTLVHDLSQMTEVQARHFLAERSGQRVCVRYRADGAGALRFRSAPPARAALVLAAASLALAACTGYVEADSLDSPDDAIACEDVSGYTIPCEDATAPPPADVLVPPGPHGVGDDAPSPAVPEAEMMGQVQEVVMGDVEIPAPPKPPESPNAPSSAESEEVELLGRMVVDPELERQWKREQRREARRKRRAG